MHVFTAGRGEQSRKRWQKRRKLRQVRRFYRQTCKNWDKLYNKCRQHLKSEPPPYQISSYSVSTQKAFSVFYLTNVWPKRYAPILINSAIQLSTEVCSGLHFNHAIHMLNTREKTNPQLKKPNHETTKSLRKTKLLMREAFDLVTQGSYHEVLKSVIITSCKNKWGLNLNAGLSRPCYHVIMLTNILSLLLTK